MGVSRPATRWRLAAGLTIVALWLAGLALLARREFLRPMSERLAAAALQVHPSSHYYVIERDGQVVGGASAEVDTTGYGIVLRHHLFGSLLEGESDSLVVRSRSSYTPTLAFGGFRIEVERGGTIVTLDGQRVNDSLLAIRPDGSAGPAGERQILAKDPLFLPATAALPLVLLNRPRVGLESNVTVFDPLLQRARTIPLRIASESLFAVVDSAVLHPERRRWTPARTEPLRAWLVTSDSSAASIWVDRSGSIVQASDGRNTRATRTTYEIAYENWRLERLEQARTGEGR